MSVIVASAVALTVMMVMYVGVLAWGILVCARVGHRSRPVMIQFGQQHLTGYRRHATRGGSEYEIPRYQFVAAPEAPMPAIACWVCRDLPGVHDDRARCVVKTTATR